MSVNPVRELLRRGLSTMPTVRDLDRAIEELAVRLEDPDVALLVAGDGFVIAENNASAFVDACVVIHLYNGGHEASTRRQLLDELTAFALAGGRDRIQGFDIHRSRAYERLMRHKGWRPRILGTAYEFSGAA
jgi:hypothetical protein